jgi:hypothetical protein
MAYVRIAVTMVSAAALAFLVAATLEVRQGKLPARQTAVFCAVVCAVTAALNLLGFLWWVSLVWAGAALAFWVRAKLLDRRPPQPQPPQSDM